MCFMNALTAEWVEKAEGDFATAGREIRVRTRPNWDAACFHAQQAAEKCLKAVLQQRGTAPQGTHSLIELLEACLLFDGGFATLRPGLVLLDRYAVLYRYPGGTADRLEAQQAFRTLVGIRSFFRQKLGLS